MPAATTGKSTAWFLRRGLWRFLLYSTRSLNACVIILPMLLMGGCPMLTETTIPGVRVSTSMGDFTIELAPDAAPLTVANFLEYVDDDFYDGTIFHRVIADFVIQGGGFTPDLTEKETRPSIINESLGGVPNLRTTVAMARTDDPDSAAAQFYVNIVDNPDLDATSQRAGYTVFGRVVEGMDVVDAIAAVETGERGGFMGVPVDDVVINSIERMDLSTGPMLDPAAQATLDNQIFQFQNLVRDVIVQALGFALGAAF